MENERLLKEIVDFCNRDGRFGAARSLTGMQASRIPDLFFEYFANLDEADRLNTARILTLGALGRDLQLSDHLPICGYLLLALCIRGYRDCLKNSVALIQSEYRDPANLRAWLAAGDSPPPPAGTHFQKQWAYAVWLRKILAYFPSLGVGEVDRVICSDATSKRFKEALREASHEHGS